MMGSRELEQRVATLEAQVEKLREELAVDQATRKKDWRRTIGAFTDDDDMQKILRDAMHLREADRKQARAKRPTKGKQS